MKKPNSHGTENQSAKKKGTLFDKKIFKLAMMLGILILSACANQATPQTEATAVSLPQITPTVRLTRVPGDWVELGWGVGM